jgi:phosphoglucosamine mutase
VVAIEAIWCLKGNLMTNSAKSSRLFGTDGVRGVANAELSPFLAMRLGLAAAHHLSSGKQNPTFVVGRDSRISSPMLESAIVAGLCSMGGIVLTPGLLPTPAVACITRHIGADAGIVISASHNPYPDNGIKFFGNDGYKLDDSVEAKITDLVAVAEDLPRPVGAAIGRIVVDDSLIDLYVKHLESTVHGLSLQGLKIIVDGANGAASAIGPRVFRELGAEVIEINCFPNGTNINADCGALHTGSLQHKVVVEAADLGIAFDGDADRVILVDELGQKVDGDHMMAFIGINQAKNGDLPGRSVVGTVMSNMGLEACLRAEGITLLRTDVGDRYVSERMRRDGFTLGGEKSGHVIFGQLTTTGDGILTALQAVKIVKESGTKLSDLASVMTEYPQVLLSIKVRDRDEWKRDDNFQCAIASAESRLAGFGRVNVRASGTEKLIRVMVEGREVEQVNGIGQSLAKIVEDRWGAR